MDQPLFSCTKCFRNFPQSEMSRSGQTCKGCNPHHSTFKQCEFCKSDFKYYLCGTICPRCQSLKSKYGDPQPCSICRLKTAFGNALVCQRCLHYRVRFGEPRECQACGQVCAFVKDEVSRQKVDGQILCWVCTYNFKLARSRERSDHGGGKRRNDASDSGRLKFDRGDPLKRTRSDDYGSGKTDGPLDGNQAIPSTQTQSLDSVYNEHLLTIGQLQDEVKGLKRQLAQKDADMLAKDRTIAELRSELIDVKEFHESRYLKAKAAAQMEQDRLTSTIRQLQKEKASISQGLKKRKSHTNSPRMASLRYSASASTLFNPDSPIQFHSSTSKNAGITGASTTAVPASSTNSGTSASGDKTSAPHRRVGPKFAPLTDDESAADSAKSSPVPPKPEDEKQLTHASPDSIRPAPSSDEDSALTPHSEQTPTSTVALDDPDLTGKTETTAVTVPTTYTETLSKQKPDSSSSPELTTSLSSGQATDDETYQQQQQPQNPPTSRASLNSSSRDPLGLDTPSESDSEADN
ncbi:Protein FAM76A [Fasciola gigantica]|uniref:Protein FAM76A n=1 Tax=Fasciola gigantica TaxID=46835 RepID=A0A504Z022_FASGI|nr:Protein FAM76A [Fasciola gigantica]